MDYNELLDKFSKLQSKDSDFKIIYSDDDNQAVIGCTPHYSYAYDYFDMHIQEYKLRRRENLLYIIYIDSNIFFIIVDSYGIPSDISTDKKNIDDSLYLVKENLKKIGLNYEFLMNIEKSNETSSHYLPYDIKMYHEKGNRILDEVKIKRTYNNIPYNQNMLNHIDDVKFFDWYYNRNEIRRKTILKIFYNSATNELINHYLGNVISFQELKNWSNDRKNTDIINSNIEILKIYNRVGKLDEFILTNDFTYHNLTVILFYLINYGFSNKATHFMSLISKKKDFDKNFAYLIFNGLININNRNYYTSKVRKCIHTFLCENYEIFNIISQTNLTNALGQAQALHTEDEEKNILLSTYLKGKKLTPSQLLKFKMPSDNKIVDKYIDTINKKNVVSNLKKASLKSPRMLFKLLGKLSLNDMLNHDDIYNLVDFIKDYYEYIPSSYAIGNFSKKEYMRDFFDIIFKYITLEEYIDIYKSKNSYIFYYVTSNTCTGMGQYMGKHYKNLEILYN